MRCFAHLLVGVLERGGQAPRPCADRRAGPGHRRCHSDRLGFGFGFGFGLGVGVRVRRAAWPRPRHPSGCRGRRWRDRCSATRTCSVVPSSTREAAAAWSSDRWSTMRSSPRRGTSVLPARRRARLERRRRRDVRRLQRRQDWRRRRWRVACGAPSAAALVQGWSAASGMIARLQAMDVARRASGSGRHAGSSGRGWPAAAPRAASDAPLPASRRPAPPGTARPAWRGQSAAAPRRSRTRACRRRAPDRRRRARAPLARCRAAIQASGWNQ